MTGRPCPHGSLEFFKAPYNTMEAGRSRVQLLIIRGKQKKKTAGLVCSGVAGGKISLVSRGIPL